MTEGQAIAIVVILWIVGAIASLATFCGMVWFALWSAKYFGVF